MDMTSYKTSSLILNNIIDSSRYFNLTRKHLEMHGCTLSIVGTDALVLQH